MKKFNGYWISSYKSKNSFLTKFNFWLRHMVYMHLLTWVDFGLIGLYKLFSWIELSRKQHHNPLDRFKDVSKHRTGSGKRLCFILCYDHDYYLRINSIHIWELDGPALSMLRRAILEVKQRLSDIKWVAKNVLWWAPLCFGRHVKPLVPLHLQPLAPTNPHWAYVVSYGSFSLCVIYKEGLRPSSGDINRRTIMMTSGKEWTTLRPQWAYHLSSLQYFIAKM
jgi:hypothetical protein